MNDPVPTRPQFPADPRPVAPVEPALEDCCRSGCQPCVFDFYEMELQEYEEALARWKRRHPGQD